MEAFSSMPPVIEMQQPNVDMNLNSLSAALAQLPNAASTVFSTFSNIIKGTAPPPPMASNVHTNDSLTFNDPMEEPMLTQPYSYGFPTEPEQITAPPPLFSPTDESIFKKAPTETHLDNNFRMGGLKKKTYAHIPGLSSNQQTIVQQNPVPAFNMPPMPTKPQPDLSNQYPPDYQPPPMITSYNTNYDKTDYKEPEKSNKFSFSSLIPTQLLEKLPAASNLSSLFGGGSDTTYSAPPTMSNENFGVDTSNNYMNQQFTSISHQQDQPQLMTTPQSPPTPMNFINPQQFKTNPFESTIAQNIEPPMTTNNYSTIPLASANVNASQQQLLPEPPKQVDQCPPTFFNPMEASKINSGRTRLSRYKNPNLIEVSNKAPILIPPIVNLFNQPSALPKSDQCFQQTPLHPLIGTQEQRPPSNPSMAGPSDVSLVSQFNSSPAAASCFPPQQVYPPPAAAASFPPLPNHPATDNLNQMFSNVPAVFESNPPVAASFPPQQIYPPTNLNTPPPAAPSFPPQKVHPPVNSNPPSSAAAFSLPTETLNQMFSNSPAVIDSNPAAAAASFPPQQVAPTNFNPPPATTESYNQMFSNAPPVFDTNPPGLDASSFFSSEITQQPSGSLFMTSEPVLEPTGSLFMISEPVNENILAVIPLQSEDDVKASSNVEEYESEYNPNETLPSLRSDMSERFDTMSLSGRSGSYVGSNLSLFATSELDSTLAMPTQSALIGDFLNKQQDPVSGINGSTSVKSLASSSAVTASKTYRPVYKHWFYSSDDLWIPFSMTDSLALDDALTSGKDVVPTDSGRFDVSITNKLRTPVFWINDSSSNEIRRCSWFYKDGDANIPFNEEDAIIMESSYEKACNTGIWCSQLPLTKSEEFFHIQDTTMMFYVIHGQSLVVKRGVDEFDIDDGEAEKVDHLMILVSGFQSQNVSVLPDELRSKTRDFLQQNYSEASDCGLVGRIEVLPVVFQSEEFTLRLNRMKSVMVTADEESTQQFYGQMIKAMCYDNVDYHQVRSFELKTMELTFLTSILCYRKSYRTFWSR